jgi:hypothetical protein
MAWWWLWWYRPFILAFMYFCGHQFRPCFPFPFFHRKCTKHFLYMESYIFWIFLVPFFVWIMNVWFVWFMIWIVWYCFICGFMDVYLWKMWGVSRSWESEGYHCFEEVRGITTLGNVKGITALGKREGYHCFGVCMAWHGFMCKVAWLGMALSARLHGLARLWGLLGLMPARGLESLNSKESGHTPVWCPRTRTYACTQPEEPKLRRIGAYISMMPENQDLCLLLQFLKCTQMQVSQVVIESR